MMQKGLLFVVACIVFGFSLLAHLPARLVIPQQYGEFQFLGIGGSLWRGEVRQILHSGKALPVRSLHWTVRPTTLLTGTLRADIEEQQTPTNRGRVGLGLWSRQIELRGLQWRLPGNALDPWFRDGVGLMGHFVIALQEAQLASDTLLPRRLKGRLDWQNAALQLDSEQWPIGSPVLRFSGEGDAINGVLTNSQPLVPGDASFQCTTTICVVELSLQPTPDAPQSLLRGLSLLGLQQTGDTFSGQITLPLD
jgi:hypothetical protein